MNSNSLTLDIPKYFNFNMDDVPNYTKYYILVCLVFIFIFIFYGKSNVEDNKVNYILIEVFLLIILVISFLINDNDVVLKIKTSLRDVLSDANINVDIFSEGNKKSNDKKMSDKKMGDNEVYHIPGNRYNYSEAREVCDKMGSRLATYDEIENAYNKGAGWCSYGWSENQLALFPTQKKLYNKLQKIDGKENDCGRQGINGGYISNPDIKYGVNCYGKKRDTKSLDTYYSDRLYEWHTYLDEESENEEKKEMDDEGKVVDAPVLPFNQDKWSYHD